MQIVSACLARDLPVYRNTYRSLRRHLPEAEIHVITRRKDFDPFRSECGSDLILWDEDHFVAGMTLKQLQQYPKPFLKKRSGWYFQQFLKLSFLNVANKTDEYFLIWDADTVLLRPLDFFDVEGRPYYTVAREHHNPYFTTFEALFGKRAHREFSFISQHQIIHKATLRKMLAEIETRNPDSKNWAWAIIENIKGVGISLFSEYETYGHYLKLNSADAYALRNLKWTRYGQKWAGYPPSPDKLEEMSRNFDYAAFEFHNSKFKRFIRRWKRRLFK
ncbi:MAG: DUF6492 family protein [Verrucomicrobiota bacterium]